MINSITDYINESIYSYALMIDGPWGVGKIYFINHELKDILDKEHKKIFVMS